MSNFDKFIFKEGSKFYVDLEEYSQENDISLEVGDTIKFSYEKKKFIAKIASSKNDVAEVSILKEITL